MIAPFLNQIVIETMQKSLKLCSSFKAEGVHWTDKLKKSRTDYVVISEKWF